MPRTRILQTGTRTLQTGILYRGGATSRWLVHRGVKRTEHARKGTTQGAWAIFFARGSSVFTRRSLTNDTSSLIHKLLEVVHTSGLGNNTSSRICYLMTRPHFPLILEVGPSQLVRVLVLLLGIVLLLLIRLPPACMPALPARPIGSLHPLIGGV